MGTILNISRLREKLGDIPIKGSWDNNLCPTYGQLMSGEICSTDRLRIETYSVGDGKTSYDNNQLVCEEDVKIVSQYLLTVITNTSDNIIVNGTSRTVTRSGASYYYTESFNKGTTVNVSTQDSHTEESASSWVLKNKEYALRVAQSSVHLNWDALNQGINISATSQSTSSRTVTTSSYTKSQSSVTINDNTTVTFNYLTTSSKTEDKKGDIELSNEVQVSDCSPFSATITTNILDLEHAVPTHTINIKASVNNTTTPKTATLTIKNGDKEEDVQIIQDAKPAPIEYDYKLVVMEGFPNEKVVTTTDVPSTGGTQVNFAYEATTGIIPISTYRQVKGTSTWEECDNWVVSGLSTNTFVTNVTKTAEGATFSLSENTTGEKRRNDIMVSLQTTSSVYIGVDVYQDKKSTEPLPPYKLVVNDDVTVFSTSPSTANTEITVPFIGKDFTIPVRVYSSTTDNQWELITVMWGFVRTESSYISTALEREFDRIHVVVAENTETSDRSQQIGEVQFMNMKVVISIKQEKYVDNKHTLTVYTNTSYPIYFNGTYKNVTQSGSTYYATAKFNHGTSVVVSTSPSRELTGATTSWAFSRNEYEMKIQYYELTVGDDYSGQPNLITATTTPISSRTTTISSYTKSESGVTMDSDKTVTLNYNCSTRQLVETSAGTRVVSNKVTYTDTTPFNNELNRVHTQEIYSGGPTHALVIIPPVGTSISGVEKAVTVKNGDNTWDYVEEQFVVYGKGATKYEYKLEVSGNVLSTPKNIIVNSSDDVKSKEMYVYVEPSADNSASHLTKLQVKAYKKKQDSTTWTEDSYNCVCLNYFVVTNISKYSTSITITTQINTKQPKDTVLIFYQGLEVVVTIEQGNNLYADLDLPSGKKWMKYNIGVETPNGVVVTEDKKGDYYQWGSFRKNYSEPYDAPFWNRNGFPDANLDVEWFASISGDVCPNGVLARKYDIVYKETDGLAHIPQVKDFQELVNNTTQTRETSHMGVHCIRFTSKQHPEKYIILPAQGYQTATQGNQTGGINHNSHYYLTSNLVLSDPEYCYNFTVWEKQDLPLKYYIDSLCNRGWDAYQVRGIID